MIQGLSTHLSCPYRDISICRFRHYRIVCTLDYSRNEQTGHIRVQRNDLTILQAVALPILSCFAACPGVIPASMSFRAAETVSVDNCDRHGFQPSRFKPDEILPQWPRTGRHCACRCRGYGKPAFGRVLLWQRSGVPLQYQPSLGRTACHFLTKPRNAARWSGCRYHLSCNSSILLPRCSANSSSRRSGRARLPGFSTPNAHTTTAHRSAAAWGFEDDTKRPGAAGPVKTTALR